VITLFTDEERKQITEYRKEHNVSVLAAIDVVVKARERRLKEREADALERIATALEQIEMGFSAWRLK
jgi:hypothetical protein